MTIVIFKLIHPDSILEQNHPTVSYLKRNFSSLLKSAIHLPWILYLIPAACPHPLLIEYYFEYGTINTTYPENSCNVFPPSNPDQRKSHTPPHLYSMQDFFTALRCYVNMPTPSSSLLANSC